jgi:hypothetical protein
MHESCEITRTDSVRSVSRPWRIPRDLPNALGPSLTVFTSWHFFALPTFSFYLRTCSAYRNGLSNIVCLTRWKSDLNLVFLDLFLLILASPIPFPRFSLGPWPQLMVQQLTFQQVRWLSQHRYQGMKYESMRKS